MKTTPLPSVGEVVSHLPMFPDAEILMEDQLIDYDKYKVGEIATLLTQRDNQAYTSLVEGIEGMKHTKRLYRNEQGAIEDVSTNAEIERNDILTDILENVVKPIYGKEYIMTQENHAGKANEMVNKEMEEQVEEFMDCWGDYFDGYICCQGFGCSCNGTKTDVEVIKHLTQALHTARTQGLRKGLEKSQELLDEMMEEGRKQGKAEEGEKWSKAVEACSDDKGNLFQNDLLLALSLTNTDVTKLI